MLTSYWHRGFSFFWSPNFDKPVRAQPTELLHKQRRQKPLGCEILQALQMSLSEAQKFGIGVKVLLRLIRVHKENCSKCKSVG